jgi:hypothetical protein
MTVVNGYAAGGDAPGGPGPIRSRPLVLKPLIRGLLRGVRPSALPSQNPPAGAVHDRASGCLRLHRQR